MQDGLQVYLPETGRIDGIQRELPQGFLGAGELVEDVDLLGEIGVEWINVVLLCAGWELFFKGIVDCVRGLSVGDCSVIGSGGSDLVVRLAVVVVLVAVAGVL